MIPVVLLVNHRTQNCGVYQFGTRILKPLLTMNHYMCYYIEVESDWEFEHWANELKPQIVVYNWYPSTMPWLSEGKVAQCHGRFKQVSIFHEVPIQHMGFDAIAHQDPTTEDGFGFPVARPIPDYRPIFAEPEVTTFGSFGFGLGGKGFDRIVERVGQEYEHARIRINIPFAAFGDADGYGARSWAIECIQRNQGKSDLQITHDLLSERELIDFLAGNTANIFLYDENYGRGISGTLDYALAAGRPIIISKSYQFQHMWRIEPKVVLGDSIKEIVRLGTDHLQKFYTLWGNDQLRLDFERIFDSLC